MILSKSVVCVINRNREGFINRFWEGQLNTRAYNLIQSNEFIRGPQSWTVERIWTPEIGALRSSATVRACPHGTAVALIPIPTRSNSSKTNQTDSTVHRFQTEIKVIFSQTNCFAEE